ncbi:tetratricopeptide repeat protein [Oceanicoccus sagamiensis]|uniref:Sel1 repeat family protein n=1 Tax=Oceanicoccus sagamiensis TaxID=716816 RepID=A0A1X9NDG3_9GAMM|nr:SEL1-like repeat protein [Oceanicoccus sagamiensis]ARN73935.1 hypothetical protein BST96_07285 [Oceanicoccus sagamiensis]
MSDEKKLATANQEFNKGDYSLALSKYIELAESGNYGCARRLGYMYYSGLGVEKSLNKSLYWLQFFPEKVDDYSSYLMAKIYLDTERSDAAYDLLEALSSHDYMPALYRLGVVNLKSGGKSNIALGVELLKRSIKQGHTKSKIDLGLYYLKSGIDPFKKILGAWYVLGAVINSFFIALRDKHDDRLVF